MQTVKDIIAELQRFNPEARVSPQIEIGGHSPATDCIIKINGSTTQGGEELPLSDYIKEKIKSLCDEIDPGVPADENSVLAKLREIIK